MAIKKNLVGATGIEPMMTESKSVALPLGYTPINIMYTLLLQKIEVRRWGD